MVRPSDEFLLAWSSLSGHEAAHGWHAIPLPSAGCIEVKAGRRSPDNAEAILLRFPTVRLPSAEKLPEGQGFSVERAVRDGSSELQLALTRRSAGSVELFASMVCDVVGALDEASSGGTGEASLLRVFLGRVGAWQEFMRKGSQVLSPEAEVGLVGELTVLRSVIETGVPMVPAVESWTGPIGGVRDFELGTGALEAKATLSTTGFPARIGSLDQLDDSVRQPLFVVGVRLRQLESGECLPDIVRTVREAASSDAEAIRLLGERLIAAGYLDAHSDRYVRRFKLVDTRIMEVADGFPRLTPGTVPQGITRASYDIDLDKADGASVPLADAMKRLGAI